AILVQGDEGSAQVVRLGHRGTPSINAATKLPFPPPPAPYHLSVPREIGRGFEVRTVARRAPGGPKHLPRSRQRDSPSGRARSPRFDHVALRVGDRKRRFDVGGLSAGLDWTGSMRWQTRQPLLECGKKKGQRVFSWHSSPAPQENSTLSNGG